LAQILFDNYYSVNTPSKDGLNFSSHLFNERTLPWETLRPGKLKKISGKETSL